MPKVASGKRSSTAWASTCAVEWRIVYSPRSLSAVTMATRSPSASSVPRSRSVPLISAITAALASRDPMLSARPSAVVPGATDLVEPSGRVIAMSAMDAEVTDRRRPLPHRLPAGADPSRTGSLPAPTRPDVRQVADRVRHAGLGGAGAVPVGTEHDDRGWGGDGVVLAGRVLVHVLLPGQGADLVHQLVGELAQHQAIADAVGVVGDVDRPADADLARPERARGAGPGRLDVAGADDADGDQRRPRAQRQARGARVPLAQLAVAAARALGVDAEELAPPEHAGGRVERPGAGVAARPVDGDHAQRGEEVLGLPVVEVLGLADERDAAGQHRRQEERIDDRRVVGAHDRRPVGRQVVGAADVGAPTRAEQRGQDGAGDRIELAVLPVVRLPRGHGRMLRPSRAP